MWKWARLILFDSNNDDIHGNVCYLLDTVIVLIIADFFVDVNECSSNPCQNSGTCNDGVNGYTCDCIPGYVGNECGTGISNYL